MAKLPRLEEAEVTQLRLSLAEALGADEIVLVTDADGIMSGDPKIVSNPERLKEIDVNTLSWPC